MFFFEKYLSNIFQKNKILNQAAAAAAAAAAATAAAATTAAEATTTAATHISFHLFNEIMF